MKHLQTILLLIAALAVVTLVNLYNRERAERKRHQNNVEALLGENEAYRTQSGQWAMSVQALELKRDEFQRLCAEQAATIRAQGIKIKRLESYSDTRINTVVDIAAPVRDTVMLRDTVRVVAGAFRWADAWVSVHGLIEGGGVRCRIESVDTLQHIVHRVPRQFLFLKWGVKELRQTVISTNPHSKIVYNRHIKLLK